MWVLNTGWFTLNAKCITRGMEVKSKFTLCCCFVSKNCRSRSFTLGYWLFYFSSVLFWLRQGKKTFTGKRLSQVSVYVACYPCPYWGESIFVTVGSFLMLNQLVAGSIMVRHMKLILVLSLPLRVYYLMRCTHNTLWGVIMTSFDSTWPYFGCVSSSWQDLQDWCYWMVCVYLFSTSQISLSLWDLSG